jgi:hypothetical protein
LRFPASRNQLITIFRGAFTKTNWIWTWLGTQCFSEAQRFDAARLHQVAQNLLSELTLADPNGVSLVKSIIAKTPTAARLFDGEEGTGAQTLRV